MEGRKKRQNRVEKGGYVKGGWVQWETPNGTLT